MLIDDHRIRAQARRGASRARIDRAARLALVALLLALPPCTARADDPVVAQAGSISMTASDVQALLAQAEPDVRDQLQRDPAALARLVRQRMVQLMLLDEAKAKKWDQSPDVAARAQQARDAVIVETYLQSLTPVDPEYPSDADVQSAYDANKARFLVPRQSHVSQIFVAEAQDAPKAADDAAQKKLRDIRSQLAKPHADFAEIARRLSDDRTSAARGGDLGWLTEEQVIIPVRSVISGLQENAVSEPIRAADGWHIVKLLGTRPAGTASLADVRETIVKALRQQRASEGAQAYVNDMQHRQPVQINEIQLARTIKK